MVPWFARPPLLFVPSGIPSRSLQGCQTLSLADCCHLLHHLSCGRFCNHRNSTKALSILQAVARASSGYLVCTLADGPLSHDVRQLLFCVEAVYLFLLAQALMLKAVAR